MGIKYFREVITTKKGEQFVAITAKGFEGMPSAEFAENKKWFDRNKFDYYKAAYNRAAGREPVANFGIREEILKTENPVAYKKIMAVATDLVPKKADKKTTKKADKAVNPPATKQTTKKADKPAANKAGKKTADPKEPTLADIFAEFKAMRAEIDSLKAVVGKGAC